MFGGCREQGVSGKRFGGSSVWVLLLLLLLLLLLYVVPLLGGAPSGLEVA
jgi:hypothetical protein